MGDRPILVVDDDDDIREALTELLSDEGYPVESAADGCEALKVMERTEPSLILLDLSMPVLNGFGLVRILTERGMKVPTIVLSAGTDLARHAADLRAEGYIGKPFEVLDLLTTVERHYQTG